MAVKFTNSVNGAENDAHTARTNMMDLWKESLQRERQNRQSAVKTAQSHQEARAELEQKLRNGQMECPTCAARTFKDRSGDGGVSFQAPKAVPYSTAGAVVASHEHEHVSASKSEDSEDVVHDSKVQLTYARCPDCGRTYVSGGRTSTTSRPASYGNANNYKPGGMDIKV
ncbi:MAG: hypothetical protein FWH02_02735 [Oscillospiraceae bacterium]|nr:hypothetical protein [Oscillospiraceae bacterium]